MVAAPNTRASMIASPTTVVVVLAAHATLPAASTNEGSLWRRGVGRIGKTTRKLRRVRGPFRALAPRSGPDGPPRRRHNASGRYYPLLMYEARSLPVLHIRKPLGIGPGRSDPERAEGGRLLASRPPRGGRPGLRLPAGGWGARRRGGRVHGAWIGAPAHPPSRISMQGHYMWCRLGFLRSTPRGISGPYEALYP
jgi:hypothetical protein